MKLTAGSMMPDRIRTNFVIDQANYRIYNNYEVTFFWERTKNLEKIWRNIISILRTQAWYLRASFYWTLSATETMRRVHSRLHMYSTALPC